MELFSPLFLFLIPVVVPAIIFFYLLKLKRREVPVSSVMLWSHLIKDVQANAPFQKLKKNLLLLLQLIIAVLAIIALSRPAVFANSMGGRNVVVILDGSASMQAREGRTTRFQAARETAEKMVSQMKAEDRMMILLSTSRTHRLTAMTSDKGALRRALRRAEPGDTTTNLRDALLLAISTAGRQGRPGYASIYILSDGAFPKDDEIETRGASLQYIKFGSSSDNVGIVALDARRMLREEGGYQLFLAVRNYGERERKLNLEFYRDEALVDVRPLSLPAADPSRGYSERAEVYTDLPETDGILRTQLDVKDDLAADNVAYAQLARPRDLKVLLVTEGNFFLREALNVDPHVQLSELKPSAYTGAGDFDVVVFENSPPRNPGPGAHLYINCAGPTAPVELRGQTTDASILDWRRQHPVMRYVQLSQIYLPEARTAAPRPWGVTLAEHEQGPVIVVGERDNRKSAYVGFPLLKTEFPTRVAFPIFFNNLVQWLALRPIQDGSQLRTGQVATLTVPTGTRTAQITTPTGERVAVSALGTTVNFADTDRAGVYTLQAGDYRDQFAANLLSRAESNIRPAERLQFGDRPLEAGSGMVRTAHEFWRWLAVIALLVLSLEWWIFHRRI